MSKPLALLIAAVGIIAGLVGYIMWHAEGFGSKKYDGSLAIGAVLLLIGIIAFLRPSGAKG